jgi:hypothetical protein
MAAAAAAGDAAAAPNEESFRRVAQRNHPPLVSLRTGNTLFYFVLRGQLLVYLVLTVLELYNNLLSMFTQVVLYLHENQVDHTKNPGSLQYLPSFIPCFISKWVIALASRRAS